METHGVAVVGLGLVGSAALSHVDKELEPIGIGVGEPADWKRHRGPFASHYDSGRVTRRIDARREWAILASRSIQRYPLIEQMSDITFHHPTGMLFVRRDADGIARQRSVADELDIPITMTSTEALDTEYRFPPAWTCIHEPDPAGFIDPRAMIRAQLQNAERQGAELRRTTARSIVRRKQGFQISLADDTTIVAEEVIIATGAYGSQLTAQPLAVSVRPEAVILAELDDVIATGLTIPSSIFLLDHPQLDDVYIVPPVRYPDDRWYVKMGGSWAGAAPLADEVAMSAWMSGQDANAQLTTMRDVLTDLLPKVPFRSFSMKPCLITDTKSGLPMIGRVDDGRIVARAGNGHAAKSADAIGALAAVLAMNQQWTDSELAADLFRPAFGTFDPGAGSRHGT